MGWDVFFMYLVGFYSCGVIVLGYLAYRYWDAKKKIKYDQDKYLHDPVTGTTGVGLFKQFFSYLKDNPKESRKIVLMILDMGSLYSLREALDQSQTEVLLKEKVLRIKTVIQPTDIVSLTEDKHLAVLLPGVNTYNDIETIARRIISSLQEPYPLKDRELSLNTNIGISVYPDNGTDIEVLMKNADYARFKAKSNGVNNFYFYVDDLNDSIKTTDSLVRDLRAAVKTNQFSLKYQPQLSLTTGEIIGVEALLRWNHPDKGEISPAHFIPVAESTGLIIPLGYWIIRTACEEYVRWGLDELKLSINLSATQFNQKDLVSRISGILYEVGMKPSNLTLEITESTSMEDITYSLKVMRELKELGVSISIDDFGTGHSSLAYLKQFPINALKIDRSFVGGIEKDANGEVLVKSIIDLAKNLGLEVVAEGVETQDQLKFLRDSQCDSIQGYLLSPPIPSEKFLSLLRTNSFMSIQTITP